MSQEADVDGGDADAKGTECHSGGLGEKSHMAIGWTLRTFACYGSFLLVGIFGSYFENLSPVKWILIILSVPMLALTLFFLYRFGGRIYLQAKRNLALPANRVMARDLRPPVLYLRSFRDDATAVPHSFVPQSVGLNLLTEEERLAWVLGEIGPLIALGAPGEGAPTLGAARTYALDGQWQDMVIELMARASLVVLRIDCESDALMWELSQAVTHLAPKQLLLLIPDNSREYECFRRRVGEECQELSHPLPAWPSFNLLDFRQTVGGAIFFRPDWKPEIIKLKGSRPGARGLEKELRSDLRPVFDQIYDFNPLGK